MKLKNSKSTINRIRMHSDQFKTKTHGCQGLTKAQTEKGWGRNIGAELLFEKAHEEFFYQDFWRNSAFLNPSNIIYA